MQALYLALPDQCPVVLAIAGSPPDGSIQAPVDTSDVILYSKAFVSQENRRSAIAQRAHRKSLLAGDGVHPNRRD
ncbi:MAG: hypothetical protein KME06_01930 [Kastovskya adunca ATA6-11-RM4]|nr:hypothetical protein [Kastovskya adunca ATA6-11-RM4]